MTVEDRIFLDKLRANVQALFKMNKDLEDEKRKLQRELIRMNEKLEQLEQEKAELNRNIEGLKFANQVLSGKDNDGEAKRKINKIVREIDKCIALLNK